MDRGLSVQEMDSYGLRAFKHQPWLCARLLCAQAWQVRLRLDVVDRFPPAILAAFVEVVARPAGRQSGSK